MSFNKALEHFFVQGFKNSSIVKRKPLESKSCNKSSNLETTWVASWDFLLAKKRRGAACHEGAEACVLFLSRRGGL